MGLQMGGVDHQPIRLTTLAVSSAEMGLKTPSRSSGSAGRRSYCAGHWDRLLAPTRPFQITKMCRWRYLPMIDPQKPVRQRKTRLYPAHLGLA